MPRILHLAAVLLLAPSLALAQSASDRLERFTRGLTGLQGQFQQEVYDADGRLSESSRGELALRAPRQFRWEYTTPFPQLIVADGDRVWIHDPDLEQVSVRRQGEAEQNSPLAALIDPAQLERQFTLSSLPDADGLAWLRLVPRDARGDVGLREARLGFDGDQLVRMSMDDALGQQTRISFSGWQRNPAFAPGLFRFVPPPGTDVIGDAEDAAIAFPVQD